MATLLSLIFVTLQGCVPSDSRDDVDNVAPELVAPEDVSVAVGETFQVVLQATDPNGDALTFALDGAPSEAALTGALVQWIPGEEDVGANRFRVSVTDDGDPPLSDVAEFVVTVDPLPDPDNQPPVADPIDDQVVLVNETIDIVLSATDPDNDALRWSVETVPTAPGTTLDRDGLLTFAPLVEDVGIYEVTATVTDDGEPPLSDAVSFTVEFARPSFDIDGTVVGIDGLPFAGDLCVDLVDQTPVISGGTPITLGSATTSGGSTFRFDGVTARPTLGLHLQVRECTSSNVLGLPGSTLVPPEDYGTLPEGATLDVAAFAMDPFQLSALATSATQLGFAGDLASGRFVYGIVLGPDNNGRDPVGGIQVGCASCTSSTFFYLDAELEDGLFGAGSVPNTETTPELAAFVVADAQTGQYDAFDLAGVLTFDDRLLVAVPGEISYVVFLAD